MSRIPDLAHLADDDLVARREELAEAVGPLLLRLEAVDDELMHRRREARRSRILTAPWTAEETANPEPAEVI